MTMEVFTGTPGSGKSYHAIVQGLAQVKATRRGEVVANFPLRFTDKEVRRGVADRWHFVEEGGLSPDFLMRLSVERGWFGHEGRCRLIIDEASAYFNARDWMVDSRTRMGWITFFSQHRKFGYDPILITQDMRMIDRQIRSLAEFEIKHVKMRQYLWFKLIPWQFFAAVRHWTGAQFSNSVRFIPYKPWVAKRYDTMKLFNLGEEYQVIGGGLEDAKVDVK